MTPPALLAEAQAEISARDPHPYYLQAYRAAEFAYWSEIPAWMAEDFTERRIRRCLDIGCAYGTLLRYVQLLTGCEAFGIDFVDTYLSPSLRSAGGIRFAVCNIELDALPWPPGFDVIVLTEVLEHFNFHPVPTLRKISGLLSPGGLLYLSTPDASQWGRVYKYYSSYRSMPMPAESLRHRIVDDHVWQYDRQELLEIMRDAGLHILRWSYSPGVVHRHFNLTLTVRE